MSTGRFSMGARRPVRRRNLKLSSVLSHQFLGMHPEDIGRYIWSLPGRAISIQDLPRPLAQHWSRVPVKVTEFRGPDGARYYSLEHEHVGVINRWFYNRLGGELAHLCQVLAD